MKTTSRDNFYSADFVTSKEPILIPREPLKSAVKVLETDVDTICKEKGAKFAREITEKIVSDFEKKEDKMAHVSTFVVVNGVIYMTYYANTKEPSENPQDQTARFVYCPIDSPDKKEFYDIQTCGEMCYGKEINRVYDTIMMQKDEDTIFIMWTARVDENYYRFYRAFSISKKQLGPVQMNRFKVGEVVNDFSASGIRSALTANGIGYKEMYADIGIMQKLSSRVEGGEIYYYSGAYSGDFTCMC